MALQHSAEALAAIAGLGAVMAAMTTQLLSLRGRGGAAKVASDRRAEAAACASASPKGVRTRGGRRRARMRRRQLRLRERATQNLAPTTPPLRTDALEFIVVAHGRAAGPDWRPAPGGNGVPAGELLWCVVGVDDTGCVVHHRVNAATLGTAIAAARHEVDALERIISASPASVS